MVTRVLDDGSWTAPLWRDHVPDIFANYPSGDALKEALADRLGDGSPEELITAHRLAVVATDIDSFLNEGYALPVIVLSFRYYVVSEREYLAQSSPASEERA